MSAVTTTGDLAGLLLLAAAVTPVAVRRARRRVAARPASSLRAARSRTAALAGTSEPSRAVVPAQGRWQAGPAPSVEDRIPGPAPLELEEAVGSSDQ